jgi:hypothetical protein
MPLFFVSIGAKDNLIANIFQPPFTDRHRFPSSRGFRSRSSGSVFRVAPGKAFRDKEMRGSPCSSPIKDYLVIPRQKGLFTSMVQVLKIATPLKI